MVTNDLLGLIRKRRTIRKFTADDVSDETLEVLLDAASVAPNRLNRRPLYYLVIRDEAVKAKLAKALRVRPYIEQAAIVIAVCADPKISTTWELDGSAAIENMLLAATSLGLGGAWVGSKGSQLWQGAVQALREAASLPENIDVVSLVCIGYPDEDKRPYEPGEKMDRQRIRYDHWDNLTP
jgi:nitroreductase